MDSAAGESGSAARGSPGSLAPRRPWAGRRVLLGVTGGIAAYKVVHVARDLTKYGAEVDVVLTRSAESFVGAVTFEGVTGRRVYTDIVAPGAALDHIRLAREANVICVAPATADFLARVATGRADDLLAAILLATRAPVLLCPAMNDVMWAHPQTQRNVTHLAREIGYHIIGPATGPLAYGEGSGPGRMEEPETIVEHIGRALEVDGPLRGRNVIVTAGPTREALDPVRVLTNRSSGRMGFALAGAAWRRGANVVLIHGPAAIPLPTGPRTIAVESADEMETAVRAQLADADVLIMAAAVADFRPAARSGTKIKKSQRPDVIPLEDAPDVLSVTRAARPAHLVSVGFALETGDGREQARRKLAEKNLDLIVLNDASAPDAGFEVDTNRVLLFDRQGGSQEVPLLPKTEVAEIILDRIAPLVGRAR